MSSTEETVYGYVRDGDEILKDENARSMGCCSVHYLPCIMPDGRKGIDQ